MNTETSLLTIVGAIALLIINHLSTTVRIANASKETISKIANSAKESAANVQNIKSETIATVEKNRADQEASNLALIEKYQKDFTMVSNEAAAAKAALEILQKSTAATATVTIENARIAGEQKAQIARALEENKELKADKAHDDARRSADAAEIKNLIAEVTDLKALVVTLNDQLKVANEQLTKVLKELAEAKAGGSTRKTSAENAANEQDDAAAFTPGKTADGQDSAINAAVETLVDASPLSASAT